MGEKRNIKLKGQRKAIKPSPKSYSASIVSGLALLYRKFSETSATWTARRFAGNKYEFHVIGAADDQAEPDGIRTFSFAQASAKAIEWDQQRQKETGTGGVYTVADAAKDWLAAWPSTRSEAGRTVAQGNVTHWINPTLGAVPVCKLETKTIQRWLEDMASKPPLKVQQHMASAAYKKLPPSRQSKIVYNPNDPETKRKRQDSANRIFNDFLAICNRAFRMHDSVISNAAWKKVKKDNAGQPKEEYLKVEEVPLLLKACEPDFAKLVYGAVATGMRYAEQAGMKRGDYSKPNGFGLITIIQPKTRKVKHVHLNAGETQLFDEWGEGLEHNDLIFTKADGSAWGKSNQQPRLKAALKKAGIKRHIRWHDLRHTTASFLAAGGAPLIVISKQLGHSSQRVTERYVSLIPDFVSQSVRDSKPIFAMPINNKA